MSKRSTSSTVLAVLSVLAFFALLRVQNWAGNGLAGLRPFFVVHTAPDGRVFVPLQDKLYVESPKGESLDVIPLDRFELSFLEGDFAVLSDDKLVLKRYPGADTLERCSMKTAKCRPLDTDYKEIPYRPESWFRLTLDEEHQRIRIADTSAHRLVLLDLEGRILRKREARFRSPSSMARVAEGEYLVSDTAHGRIVRISGRDDDTFGTQLEESSVTGWSKQGDHTFPKGIAITRDGARWIVLTDVTINKGEFYRQGPEKDAKATLLPLPEGTNTLNPESLGDSVLLPDGGLFRIHHFAADGTRLPDFGSPVLRDALSARAERGVLLDRLLRGSFAGLFLAAGLLLFALLRSPGEPKVVEEVGTASRPAPRSPSPLPGGEVVFEPRSVLLSPSEERRGLLLLEGGYTLVSVLPLLFAGILVLQGGLAHMRFAVLPWLILWLSLSSLVMGLRRALIFWGVKRHRLILDERGLRYVSPFKAPLAALLFLPRGWEVEWRRLTRAELRAERRRRTSAETYSYVLRVAGSMPRRVYALVWMAQGEPGLGMTAQAASRLDDEQRLAVVRDTWFYQHLTGFLSARRDTRPPESQAP